MSFSTFTVKVNTDEYRRWKGVASRAGRTLSAIAREQIGRHIDGLQAAQDEEDRKGRHAQWMAEQGFTPERAVTTRVNASMNDEQLRTAVLAMPTDKLGKFVAACILSEDPKAAHLGVRLNKVWFDRAMAQFEQALTGDDA